MNSRVEFTPKGLIPVFERAWTRETSSSPERWSEENRALGQCAVTAAWLSETFGGDVLNSVATPPHGPAESHYLNLINGQFIDLTKRQFPVGTQFSEPAPKLGQFATTREYVLSYEATAARYEILRRRMSLMVR